jgi:hypothetical protein
LWVRLAVLDRVEYPDKSGSLLLGGGGVRSLPPAGHAAGEKRAIVAVARALLIAIYHMLKDGTKYRDLGPEQFDRIDREAVVRPSVGRLERLGYQVTVERLAA